MRTVPNRPRRGVLLLVAVFLGGCTGSIGNSTNFPPTPAPGVGTKPDPGDQVDPGVVEVACSGEKPGRRLLRLLTRSEYALSVAALLGLAPPDVSALPVEPQVKGYDNNADASVVTSRHVDEYLVLAESLAERAMSERRGALVTCGDTGSACQRAFVESHGRRIFRRPLTADEVARYVALFDSKLSDGFDDGAKLVLASMLVSPYFLYRSELGEQNGGLYRLTPYEIATALAFAYWGTAPDDALLDAAERGDLSSAEGRQQAARRLLSDRRSRDRVAAFADRWLGTTALLRVNKDTQLYPRFTDAVRESMAEEQRRFVQHVTFDLQGTFRDLLTLDDIFANRTLRDFYGIEGGSGDGFERVAGGPSRGGLLRLGSILASHAHSNESSPIKRGTFVRERLLCHHLEPPPPSLDTTPPGLDPTLTTRERFARHTADPACSSCHQYIDGLGFGFEGYDGVGALRLVENGIQVDPSGELVGLERLSDGVRLNFRGPQELAAILAQSRAAEACLATHWFRFVRGHGVRHEDLCALQTLQRSVAGGGRIIDLLVSAADQTSFWERAD